MSRSKLKIDIKKEKYIHFIFDIIAIIISLLFLNIVAESFIPDFSVPEAGFASLLQAIFLISFMGILERYSHITMSWNEKLVVFILSGFYSCLLMIIINLIVFHSTELVYANAVLGVISVLMLILSGSIIEKILNSARLFEKPKILIIEDSKCENNRIKRIKYGIVNKFDPWYEQVDTNNIAEVKKFINEKFDDYDSICVLDNISVETYQLICYESQLRKKDIYIVPKMLDVNCRRSKTERFDDILAVYIPNYAIGVLNSFIKRFIDIIGAVIAIILAAIPMLIISLAIKLTSPGPVFYKQIRLTKGKKQFYIYKFRTMIPDAEKISGPTFAQKDDDRITKIGKILRNFRLDELPQLFNILKGDMSIVGPRPERPFFVEQFEKEIDSYNYRFTVKAGLTSLSHVYGRYSTYIKDRTYYDLYYIMNYSLFLDLKIMLLTTKTIFLKSAAEGNDEYKLNNNGELNKGVEELVR